MSTKTEEMLCNFLRTGVSMELAIAHTYLLQAQTALLNLEEDLYKSAENVRFTRSDLSEIETKLFEQGRVLANAWFPQ